MEFIFILALSVILFQMTATTIAASVSLEDAIVWQTFFSSTAYDEQSYNGDYRVNQITYDLYATDTNFYFSTSGIFKRECPSCVQSHQTIYYKRLTPIPAGFDLYNLVLTTWSSQDNC